METITFQQTTPILRRFDVAKAQAFYVDFLGFTVDWKHQVEANFPLYMQMQVSCNGLTLHLTEHHGDCCLGAAIFVIRQGLDAFYQEISSQEYAYVKPGIEETFYNAHATTIPDPLGNRLSNEYKQPEQV